MRKEIQQHPGTGSRRTRRNVPGIILNAGAEPQLLQLLEIKLGPHLDALGLQQLALLFEPRDAIAQFLADADLRPVDLLLRRRELLARKNVHRLERFHRLAGQGIEPREPLDLIAKELDAQGVLGIGRVQLDHVAADAELAAGEVVVIARILDAHQFFQQGIARDRLPDPQRDDHALVVVLAADAVDARHAGDDHDIAPREKRGHRREAQALDVIVHGGIFFDERVGARDVGFWLVKIEVADEVFDSVVRKKTFELGVKLRG